RQATTPQVTVPNQSIAHRTTREERRPARRTVAAAADSIQQLGDIPMKRWSFFLYGVVCHLLFVATFAYMAGFIANLLPPTTLDSTPTVSVGWAVLIDLALIALFAVQHSVMARPGFKRVWTQVVPQPIERSTYVLIASLVSFLLMWQWQGIDAIVWDVQNPIGRGLLWGLFAAGFLFVFFARFVIDHFDLFCTPQVWLSFLSPPSP